MLVGREAELARVHSALEAARAGVGTVLVLRGEAGLGKTALLRAAERGAGDLRILRCAGVEAEDGLAYAGLHQLVHAAAGALGALPPAQARALRAALGLAGERGADRFLVSAGLLSLLGEAAGERPLLAVVDDAQWLDRESLQAIAFAARRLEAEPVVVLIGVREPAELPELDGLPHIDLAPLADDDARALLHERHALDLSPAVRDRVVAHAAGNPLALLELPTALTPGQLHGDAALPQPLPLGPTLERAFRRRLERLPAPSRAAVLLVAADETGELAAVTRALEPSGLGLGDLAPAERAGLVRVDGPAVAFAHPLMRAAVLGGATAAERARAHAALADALDAHAEPDRAVWHRAAALAGPDAGVGDALAAAAARARERAAHAAAARAEARAADLAPDAAVRTGRLVAAAGDALRAGALDDALALLDRAGTLEGAAAGEALVVRATVALDRGRPADADELLLAAAAQAPPGAAVMLLLGALEAQVLAGRFDRAAEVDARAARLTAPDPLALDFLRGLAMSFRGEHAAAVPVLERALARLDGSADPALLIRGAFAASHLGDAGRTSAYATAALAAVRADGLLDRLAIALWLSSAYAFWGGRLPEAAADAEEGRRLADATGQRTAAAFLDTALACVAGQRGDDARCRAHAERALAEAEPRGLGGVATAASVALAELDLGAGRPEAALERLERLVGAERHPVWSATAAAALVEAAALAGAPARGAPGLERLATWTEATGAPWGRPLVARSRALVAAEDPDTGEALLEEALTLHAAHPAPMHEARTRLHLGALVRRRRRRADARPHLRAALEAFERAGAAAWADRAATELRATGQTARRRDPGTARDLTPQELQIARLVAGGAGNRDIAARLFLSRRTVEYHLRKVYAKLGISSRTELTPAALGDDGATPPS